ncbi:uncharacterized protein LACBIDRAFT_313672 [Laccaria bicolor S238N-H82]|uniref:Predicted protein n=1 Tax=Laccaria bicolor (strain S238N-H82 / ATCC MYA-4686) TaxID=486041 RepID=B0D0J5_LACBS|nr:uncharacterized protein LACBIDRAFT_313672 [Laccaria bicolor S238N-H82]EDR11472.1 predicted protein [Laccaria bicolor S238N-H82]|eukprot:XP_001877369.1 predicted protein [Laccaria bicolor S238N-H82]
MAIPSASSSPRLLSRDASRVLRWVHERDMHYCAQPDVHRVSRELFLYIYHQYTTFKFTVTSIVPQRRKQNLRILFRVRGYEDSRRQNLGKMFWTFKWHFQDRFDSRRKHKIPSLFNNPKQIQCCRIALLKFAWQARRLVAGRPLAIDRDYRRPTAPTWEDDVGPLKSQTLVQKATWVTDHQGKV